VEVPQELHEEDQEEKDGEALGPQEGDQGHQGGAEEVRPHEEPLAILGVRPGREKRGEDHGAEKLHPEDQGHPEGVFREEVDQNEKGHPVDFAPRLGDQVGEDEAGEGFVP
jgi:hypothetical protein